MTGRWWAARWPTTTCASCGIRPQVRVELDGIEYIAKLVAEGLGVSVLPDWAVTGRPIRELRKWPLPPPCPSAHRRHRLWQRSTVRAPLVEALVDIARAHFTQPAEQGQRISARASTR
jgi:DNA-binding transcriptional LysR family regulator